MTVYEFPDSATADAAADAVTPDGWGVAGSQFEWVGAPRFWRWGRTVILYVGEDQAFVESMSQLLGTQFAGS